MGYQSLEKMQTMIFGDSSLLSQFAVQTILIYSMQRSAPDISNRSLFALVSFRDGAIR